MDYMPNLQAWPIPELSGSASAAITYPIPPPQSNLASRGPALVQPTTTTLYTSPSNGRIHVTKITATCTAAQIVGCLSPLNWTTLAANGSATTGTSASITLTNDPGNYTVGFRGSNLTIPGFSAPTPPFPVVTANNVIAANDFIMFQAQDGTWWSDIIAGVTTPGSSTVTVGLTNGMPNVKAGSMVFWFGVQADLDPATGFKRPFTTFAASSARADWYDNTFKGGFAATLFNGDGMLIYGANTDNTLKINSTIAYYSWR